MLQFRLTIAIGLAEHKPFDTLWIRLRTFANIINRSLDIMVCLSGRCSPVFIRHQAFGYNKVLQTGQGVTGLFSSYLNLGFIFLRVLSGMTG